jgi:hypothetical protein
MKSPIGLCVASLAAAGLLFAAAANAQDKSSPPASPTSPPGATTAPANIPDAKLDQVAAAVKKVSAVSNTYEQQLAQAPATDKDRIVGEADKAMRQAVTDQGISVDEYLNIMKVAQNDPGVRDKLVQRLK